MWRCKNFLIDWNCLSEEHVLQDDYLFVIGRVEGSGKGFGLS